MFPLFPVHLVLIFRLFIRGKHFPQVPHLGEAYITLPSDRFVLSFAILVFNGHILAMKSTVFKAHGREQQHGQMNSARSQLEPRRNPHSLRTKLAQIPATPRTALMVSLKPTPHKGMMLVLPFIRALKGLTKRLKRQPKPRSK